MADRFGPSGVETEDRVELAERAPQRRPEDAAVTMPLPKQREEIRYQKPSGGLGNLVLWLFAAGGVVAAIGVGAYYLRGSVEGTPAAPAALAAGGPQSVPVAAATPAPKPVTYRPLDMGDAVLVQVEVSPKNAQLMLDGAPLPSNPVRLPRGSQHKLGAVADGFEPAVEEITADAAKTVRFKLRKARR